MDLAIPQHSPQFRLRRFLNWFPLGLAYAFLYMGRYNLTVSKNALGDLMTKAEFGEIFGVGAIVYGCSFLVNGPLTDRVGGRRTMLIGVIGSIAANVSMGLVLYGTLHWNLNISVFWAFLVLYAANMYFQSFGAVAIVTVKAPWFHVRERGTFSTIFGVMISLGIYFAFDWGTAIVDATRGTLPADLGFVASIAHTLIGAGGQGVDANYWVFFAPTILMSATWIAMFFFLRDTPSKAGFKDFQTGEESVSDDGERLPVKVIFLRLITHPVLLVICGIEFCSGVMRNGVMHWYTFFAKETGFSSQFWITKNWGLMLLIAGVSGAVLCGWASDRFFQSRRAPMAAILYGVMLAAAVVMCFTLDANLWFMGASVTLISMSVIGVHGIMSGTSTVDFGGTKNGGAAVGIVDGLVYLGTAVQSFAAGHMTPTGEAAKDPSNWIGWPAFLVPFAAVGLFLSLRIWNELPKAKRAAKPEPTPVSEPERTPEPVA